MPHPLISPVFRGLAVGLGAFLLAVPASAYKAPARKICKTLLVMTDAQKAATGKKDEKKEEKKPAGHH